MSAWSWAIIGRPEGLRVELPDGRAAELVGPLPAAVAALLAWASGPDGWRGSSFPASSDEAKEEEAPFVCPGCYAVGEEPCSPGCIDAKIEAERERRQEIGEEEDEW